MVFFNQITVCRKNLQTDRFGVPDRFVRPQSAGGKRRRGSPTERYVISSAGQAQKKAVANSERPKMVCLTGFVRPQSAGGKRRRGSPTERYVISSAGQAQKKRAVANSERPEVVCLTGFEPATVRIGI